MLAEVGGWCRREDASAPESSTSLRPWEAPLAVRGEQSSPKTGSNKHSVNHTNKHKKGKNNA